MPIRKCRFPAVGLCFLLLPALSCRRTPPPGVAATVNNRSITYTELDKNYASQFPQPQEGASEDQTTMQKLELLRSMIDNEIMLQKAEKLGLMAGDADVETELNKMKAPMTK